MVPVGQCGAKRTLRLQTDPGCAVEIARYLDSLDFGSPGAIFAQGQLEYELHLGVPANAGDKLEYEPDDPFLSAYLDYGLTPSWTAGVTVQVIKLKLAQ